MGAEGVESLNGALMLRPNVCGGGQGVMAVAILVAKEPQGVDFIPDSSKECICPLSLGFCGSNEASLAIGLLE